MYVGTLYNVYCLGSLQKFAMQSPKALIRVWEAHTFSLVIIYTTKVNLILAWWYEIFFNGSGCPWCTIKTEMVTFIFSKLSFSWMQHNYITFLVGIFIVLKSHKLIQVFQINFFLVSWCWVHISTTFLWVNFFKRTPPWKCVLTLTFFHSMPV